MMRSRTLRQCLGGHLSKTWQQPMQLNHLDHGQCSHRPHGTLQSCKRRTPRPKHRPKWTKLDGQSSPMVVQPVVLHA